MGVRRPAARVVPGRIFRVKIRLSRACQSSPPVTPLLGPPPGPLAAGHRASSSPPSVPVYQTVVAQVRLELPVTLGTPRQPGGPGFRPVTVPESGTVTVAREPEVVARLLRVGLAPPEGSTVRLQVLEGIGASNGYVEANVAAGVGIRASGT